MAAVRDIAATYYTYGEGERLTAKMRELALSPGVAGRCGGHGRSIQRSGRGRVCGGSSRGGLSAIYDFAALVIAGFTPQEICVMLGMSLNGVYTLKSKLKRRIAESQAPDRERLMGFFA